MDEEIKENMASVTECVFGILEEIKNINKNIDLLILKLKTTLRK